MNDLSKAALPGQVHTGIIIIGGMQKMGNLPRYSLFNVNHDARKYDSLTNAHYPYYFSRKQPNLNWENQTLVYGKSTLSDKYNPDVYSYTRELDRAEFLVLLNYDMIVDSGKLRGFEGRIYRL